MKKALSILLIILALQSCSNQNLNTGGAFIAENSDLFYALEINNNLDAIKIFILNQYSSQDTKEILESRKVFDNYFTGKIKIIGSDIIFSELDSDIVPSERPRLTKMTYYNRKIHADCQNLFEYFYGNLSFINCASTEIIFLRENK